MKLQMASRLQQTSLAPLPIDMRSNYSMSGVSLNKSISQPVLHQQTTRYEFRASDQSSREANRITSVQVNTMPSEAGNSARKSKEGGTRPSAIRDTEESQGTVANAFAHGKTPHIRESSFGPT